MRISIQDAEHLLFDLVERAVAGEQIILTHNGNPVGEIKPIHENKSFESSDRANQKAKSPDEEITAATADHFLYDDETGMPN